MGAFAYLSKRALPLFVTVVIATYLAVLIVNIGGYVDEIVKAQLMEDIGQQVKRDPRYRVLPPEEQDRIVRAFYEVRVKELGLDQPFLIKSFVYLRKAITLDLGKSQYITSNTGSKEVRPRPGTNAAKHQG